jgi:crossover junction endodeoxyribonuclease RusA
MTGDFELKVPLIPGKTGDAPPLTANQRLHWAEKNRRTQMVREHVAWRAREAKVGAQEHVVVQLHFVPPDRRHRDPANLTATQKPAVDGLVDAGVVPDDTPRYVTELMPVIHEPSYGVTRMWLVVRPVSVSAEDRAAIAEDTRFDRTQDAAGGDQ